MSVALPERDFSEEEAMARRPTHPRAGAVVTGKITEWHFVDRKGVVQEAAEPNEQFPILRAGAFESLMPTMHRDLRGTQVTFHIGEFGEATRIIINATTLPRDPADADVKPTLGKKDHRQTALNVKAYADMRAQELEAKRRWVEERKNGSVTIRGSSARVVCPATMKGTVTAWSKLHRTGMIEVDRGANRPPLRYVIQSTNDFLDAMPSSSDLRGCVVDFRPVHTHIIENVQEVQAATGYGAATSSDASASSTDKQGAALKDVQDMLPSNVSVSLGDCTNMVAEDITVLEYPAKPTAEEAAAAAAAAKKAAAFNGVDENELPMDTPGPHYGIITRWSGGQGTIEGGTGRTFFIEGVHSFGSFDPNQAALRGAVVQFDQNQTAYRYAINIVILSEIASSGGVGDALPPQQLPLQAVNIADFDSRLVAQVDYSNAIADSNVEGAYTAADASAAASGADGGDNAADGVLPTRATGSESDPFAHLPIKKGVVVTYSPKEFAGIIEEEGTGIRYVLRDASKDVVGFASPVVKKTFEKSCSVSFVGVGASGRIAARVRLEQTKQGDKFDQDEAEAAAAKKAADRAKDLEESGVSETDAANGDGEAATSGPVDEATASPMAKEYWLRRFERVGANMTEYRKHAAEIKPPEGNEHLDDYAKDDPWFNDPKRNHKVRGNATVSDMMKISPPNLMNLVMQGQKDPNSLEETKKKIEKRIPPEMQMKCREEAKTMAPKFLKALQEKRERGNDPAFNFYN